MVLEGDGEPVRGRPGQAGAGDEAGQGGRSGLERGEHEGGFVEHADSARVVHIADNAVSEHGMQVGSLWDATEGRPIADGHSSVSDTQGRRSWAGPWPRRSGTSTSSGAPTGEPDLLYIDLHLIHEVTSPQAFDGLRLAGRTVRRPDLTLATEDHNVPTLDWDKPIADPVSRTQVETLRSNAEEFGVRLHPLGDVEQGIVHVVGPQLGLTQPGMTIVCGDSHTSTHGAFGAIAFGIGTSEVEHVLATQTLMQAKPKTMAVTVNGSLPDGRHRQGPGAHADRAHRHRRRPGLHRGVPRPGHRGALDGGPDDGLQHVHRVGREGRPDRARPDDLRLHRGPPRGADRAPTGTPPSSTGRRLRHRRRRDVRQGDRPRRLRR